MVVLDERRGGPEVRGVDTRGPLHFDRDFAVPEHEVAFVRQKWMRLEEAREGGHVASELFGEDLLLQIRDTRSI